MRLTVQHVDFAKLVALSDTCLALEEQVQQTLAALVGHSLQPKQIQVQLRPGSVLVDARVVNPSSAQVQRWQSEMKARWTLEANLQASISGISGIHSACTGPVAISNVSAGIEELAAESPHISTHIIMVAIIALNLGFVLGMLIVARNLLGPGEAPFAQHGAQNKSEPVQPRQVSWATAALLSSSAASLGNDVPAEGGQGQSRMEAIQEQEEFLEDETPPVRQAVARSRHRSAPHGFVSSLQTIFEVESDTNPSNP